LINTPELNSDLMSHMLKGLIHGWAHEFPGDNYKRVMPVICDAIKPLLSRKGEKALARALVELDKELKEAKP